MRAPRPRWRSATSLLPRRGRDGIGARFDALVAGAREALGGIQWEINGRTAADHVLETTRSRPEYTSRSA
jgi:hypothetical protein